MIRLWFDGGVDGMACWRSLLPRVGETIDDGGAAFVEIVRVKNLQLSSWQKMQNGAIKALISSSASMFTVWN